MVCVRAGGSGMDDAGDRRVLRGLHTSIPCLVAKHRVHDGKVQKLYKARLPSHMSACPPHGKENENKVKIN